QNRRFATGEAELPAAAQGSVYLDQAQGDFTLGLRQRVLELHQRRLQLGDAGEVDRPRLVLDQGNLDGLGGRGDALGLELRALLRFQKGHQAVFYVLSGREHRVLIGGHQLLERRLLPVNVIQDPTAVENV